MDQECFFCKFKDECGLNVMANSLFDIYFDKLDEKNKEDLIVKNGKGCPLGY